MKLKISGLHYANYEIVEDIVSDAGFGGGSLRNHLDTTATLDIGSIEECKRAGIPKSEICRMIGELIVCGFRVEQI